MDYSYTCETLENGLKLAWMDLPHVHSVALHATVRSGPAYESKDNNGVSHVLEHLHMAVTRRHATRSELEAAFAGLPAIRDAQTTPDTLEFVCEGPPNVTGDVAKLMAELLEIREYPEDAVASEKRLIESELATDQASIESLKMLFKDHPFALPPAGTRRSVARISSEELDRFDRLSFAPNRIVVAIVGRLLPDALQRAREHLGQLRGGKDDELPAPAPPIVELPIVRRINPTSRYRNVLMGFLIIGHLTPMQRVALRLLDYALSLPAGPLTEKMRYGDARTYAFGSDVYGVLHTRLFFLFGQTPRRNREAFLKTVLALIADIKGGKASSDWFAAPRRTCQYVVEQALDSPRLLAARISAEEATAVIDTPITINEELELLARISTTDLQKLAAQFFTLDRFFLFFDARTRLFDRARVERLAKSYLS